MKQVKSSILWQKVILKGDTKELQEFALSDRSPALTLRAQRGSNSSVVVECSARKKNAYHMLKTALEPRSVLTLVFVWRGRQSVNISQQFRVDQGARLHLLNITRGSCVQETVSEVAGARGESRIDWIVHARGTMECRLSVRNVFQGKNGKGNLTIRGVVEEKAKVSCNGAVEIEQKASGTQAHLTERILLLDPLSRADAIPSLDVKTHDVQASHSASVSRIHPEDLFYFASRGISEKKARKLFIDGFLSGMLEDIPNDALRREAKVTLSE
ncbi:MAG: SufD family Fe-S cluster assembly protein [Candidatus Peribacteraceae bacterium]|nr:SufD family Fe-S cluster assembly protein [Candidatus Peribacteraceae bacterium]MDD5739813.1 SufD family Fe-S cluster assembly protein [Candidatus Peribacteraceae bacterium]